MSSNHISPISLSFRFGPVSLQKSFGFGLAFAEKSFGFGPIFVKKSFSFGLSSLDKVLILRYFRLEKK